MDIKSIPLATEKALANVAQAKREYEANIELVKIIAKLKRQAYLSYIEEGFTKEQALELCKQLG